MRAGVTSEARHQYGSRLRAEMLHRGIKQREPLRVSRSGPREELAGAEPRVASIYLRIWWRFASVSIQLPLISSSAVGACLGDDAGLRSLQLSGEWFRRR